MRNKTLLLIFLMFINLVCVTCPSSDFGENSYVQYSNEDSSNSESEDSESMALERCITDIFSEFENGSPKDDFLHALLNIKYDTVFYSKDTKFNENVFCGNKEALNIMARGYYMEMYYTLMDMDPPPILNSQRFCEKKYIVEEEECINKIAKLGCDAYGEGIDCIKHLYIHWKTTYDPESIPGTESLTDKQLFQIISAGTDRFSDSSQNGLKKRFQDRKWMKGFSDEKLLRDFYKANDDRRENIKELKRSKLIHESYDVEFELYDIQYEQDLYEARYNAYGIGNVSYSDLCKEYRRRQNGPKPFDKLYATYLSKKIKDYDGCRFKSREKYCVDYLREQNKREANLNNFNTLRIN